MYVFGKPWKKNQIQKTKMAFQLNSNQINYLNIALMVLSAGLAFSFPFETFLLAYAVLGPLHYLTEISWLHDKGYYTQGRHDYLFLVVVSTLVSVAFFGWAPAAPKGSAEFLTGTAFVGALFFVLLRKPAARWAALVPAALVSFLFSSSLTGSAFLGLFLPTLVHVFIFTGMFILVGALRGKSLSGIMSLAVFTLLAAGLLLCHPAHAGYQVSVYVQDSYGVLQEDGTSSSPFIALNFYVMKALHPHDFGSPKNPGTFVQGANGFLYQSPWALSFMAFVAFAYTYHYFNWFSKTSIIGWHEIPRRRALAILALWAISLALYAVNYSLGLRWLFFLSFTHVVLEFPLNQLTLIGIGKEFRKWALPSPVPVPARK